MSVTSPLAIAADETMRFYRTLFAEGVETNIRCIHPLGRTEPKKHPTLNYWGSLDSEEAVAFIGEWNEKGYGIFLVVNQPDPVEGYKRVMEVGKGIEDKHITKINALFVEIDRDEDAPGAHLAMLKAAPLPPSMIIRSSLPHKLHAYWLVADCPVNQFSHLQKQLAARFGGDPTVCNPARVMRVPGFYHTKGEPIQSILLEVLA